MSNLIPLSQTESLFNRMGIINDLNDITPEDANYLYGQVLPFISDASTEVSRSVSTGIIDYDETAVSVSADPTSLNHFQREAKRAEELYTIAYFYQGHSVPLKRSRGIKDSDNNTVFLDPGKARQISMDYFGQANEVLSRLEHDFSSSLDSGSLSITSAPNLERI